MEVGIPQDPQPWLPQRIVSLACDPLRTLRQQRAILQLSRMDQIEGVQRLTALTAPLHDSYQKTFTDQFVTTITRSLYVTSCPAIVRGLFCPNLGRHPSPCSSSPAPKSGPGISPAALPILPQPSHRQQETSRAQGRQQRHPHGAQHGCRRSPAASRSATWRSRSRATPSRPRRSPSSSPSRRRLIAISSRLWPN